MSYPKTLITSTVATVALSLVAMAGTASATALYSGGTKLAQGTSIEATGTNMVYQGGFATISCGHSELAGKTSTTGGSAQTVELAVSNWTVTECNATWTPLKNGKLVFHWTSGVDGTVTSEGWEWTMSTGGISCVYGTPSATSLGTLKGATKASAPAVLYVSASLTRIAGGFLCANPSTLTGTYTFSSPVPLHLTAS